MVRSFCFGLANPCLPVSLDISSAFLFRGMTTLLYGLFYGKYCGNVDACTCNRYQAAFSPPLRGLGTRLAHQVPYPHETGNRGTLGDIRCNILGMEGIALLLSEMLIGCDR